MEEFEASGGFVFRVSVPFQARNHYYLGSPSLEEDDNGLLICERMGLNHCHFLHRLSIRSQVVLTLLLDTVKGIDLWEWDHPRVPVSSNLIQSYSRLKLFCFQPP